MNLPNILTLARVAASFAVCVALCVNVEWFALSAFVLFLAGAVTDWFDGYFARKYSLITNFGKFMDALCDKIMILGIAVVMIALNIFGEYNLIAAFCVMLTVTREFFVSGIRMMAAKEGVVIAAEKMGKYKTAFQMVSLGAFILANSVVKDFGAADTFFWTLCHDVGVVMLLLSTFLAGLSGINYAVKYRKLYL